jgi:hypothetical protein
MDNDKKTSKNTKNTLLCYLHLSCIDTYVTWGLYQKIKNKPVYHVHMILNHIKTSLILNT